ncbi:MAG: TonB-dependent receptor, partial [Alloprevotella sp.]|nr:TonB-dependent receptor [Alloprevotella sp.]
MRKTLLLVFASVAAAGGAQPDSIRTASLGEAVVTGTRSAEGARDLPMTLSVVGRDRLTADFRSSLLPTLTEQVPGLFVSTRGMMGYGVSTGAAGTMKVRGVGGMASLLVLVDGQPQYAGLMGHPVPDAYQTLLAERVEVLRGPASVLYGSNAMGGVMNIVTRQRPADGLHHDIHAQGGSYGTVETGLTSRLHRGNFSGTAAYNFGRTDNHRPDMGFLQHTGFVKLGYDFSDHWAVTGDVSLTYFKSSNPGPVAAPLLDNDQEVTRGIAAIALTNRYAMADGALQAYYNWGHHHINDGYSPGGTPRSVRYEHDDLVAGLSVYETFRLFPGNHTTLGADYQHFGGKAFNRDVATREEIPLSGTEGTDFSEDDVAGYIDVRQRVAPWLTLNAGLRADYHSRAGLEWVPQGGATFHLYREAEIRLMVSKGFRNPTIRELYLFRPKNADLDPERLMNYEVSYRQAFLGGRIHVGANLFYLKAENLISTPMLEGRPQNINTGRLENSGL